MTFKANLKKSVASSVEPIKEIFDRTCGENPEMAARINYESVARTLQKNRLINFPAVPKTIEEFRQSISANDDLKKHLKGFYSVANTQYGPIFFSNQIVDSIGEISNISFDGTFYTCPKLFSQLFIVLPILEASTAL